MGSNGVVTETAHLHVDRDKYESSYDRIFGSGKTKEKTKIEILAETISSKHQISTIKAKSIIQTISMELKAEVDCGYLAEELLK